MTCFHFEREIKKEKETMSELATCQTPTLRNSLKAKYNYIHYKKNVHGYLKECIGIVKNYYIHHNMF